MVGHALDLLDMLGVRKREIQIDIAQAVHGLGRHTRKLGKALLTKGDEILHLHTYTVADQGIFRKILVKRLALVAVAAVNRGNGRKWA
jgi:hypothetical protein